MIIKGQICQSVCCLLDEVYVPCASCSHQAQSILFFSGNLMRPSKPPPDTDQMHQQVLQRVVSVNQH